MKKNIIIFGLICGLLLGYLGFKLYLTLRINPMFNDENIAIKDLINDEIITISKNYDYEDEFSYGNFTLKNTFTDFKQDENAKNIFKKENENNTVIGFYEDSSYLENIKKMLNEIDDVKHDYQNIFNKYDITDDLKLYSFLTNYDMSKVSVFTPISKIIEKKVVGQILELYPFSNYKVTIIDGDLNGYILDNGNASRSALIKYNDKNYIIMFINKDYFNNEKIIEILSTLKISDGNRVDMYRIGNFDIYSDEKDPMFYIDGEKVYIKDFLESSNCTIDCIHNYSEAKGILNDGGTKYFEYEVDNQTYYLVECNKFGSSYNMGKDVLIGKDLNKLINYC